MGGKKTVFCLPALAVLAAACMGTPAPPPQTAPLLRSSVPAATLPLSTELPPVAFLEATPAAPLDVRGTFIYAAGDGSLWQQRAQGGEPTTLIERSTEAIAQMPAYTPNGRAVAFSALLFLPDGQLRGDIRMIDAAGGTARTVLMPEGNDTVYFYPRFAQDGRMLVTRIENLQTTDEQAWLEWVIVPGGERTRVVDKARDADISRDDERIAFVRLDVTTMRSGLWIAGADGANEQELVDESTFASIFSPRFSPDGEWLAFSVHGTPQKNLPEHSSKLVPQCGQAGGMQAPGSCANVLRSREDDACHIAIFFLCFVHTAHAHSAPGALWRVNLNTGRFQQLTDIYDDTPMSAWLRDGVYLAIHDFTGIRLIDLPGMKIYPLFLEDGGSGGFDWTE